MFQPDRLLKALRDAQAIYVVVGGFAAVAQGATYMTSDLDVCYQRDDGNHQRIAAAIQPLKPSLRNAPIGLPFKFDARTLNAGLNFTLSTDAGDVDFLGEISGLGDYAAVKSAAEPRELFGHTVFVLTLEGLIVAKQAAGRTKDLLHLSELRALQALRGKSEQP